MSKKTQRINKAQKRNSAQKRKNPWAGWSRVKPTKKERKLMKHKCGDKCFLGPNQSFPICTKRTCKINKKGVWAAYVRARQWSSKTNKNKKIQHHIKNKHTKRNKKVAIKAKKLLKKL